MRDSDKRALLYNLNVTLIHTYMLYVQILGLKKVDNLGLLFV